MKQKCSDKTLSIQEHRFESVKENHRYECVKQNCTDETVKQNYTDMKLSNGTVQI